MRRRNNWTIRECSACVSSSKAISAEVSIPIKEVLQQLRPSPRGLQWLAERNGFMVEEAMSLSLPNPLIAIQLHRLADQLGRLAIRPLGEFLEFTIDRFRYMHGNGLHMYQYMASLPVVPIVDQSAGRFVCQSVARWNMAAACSRRSSSNGRHCICRPMGRAGCVELARVKLQGWLMTSMPARLAVTV